MRYIWLGALAVCLLLSAGGVGAESCLPASCGVTTSEINAYPYPNARQLPIDEALLYGRDYRPVIGDFAIYNQPNGEPAETYIEGYTFVTVRSETDGWAQIADGRWVRTESLGDQYLPSRFTGVELPPHAPPYTMAWTLRHLRGAKTPGGPESATNPFLYRYSRVNIYATVEVDGYNWYQIGPHQWVHQFKVAKLLPVSRPVDVDTERWISIDLYEQVVIAYEGVTPVFATLVSSGMSEWQTNEGVFHVYVRFPETRMAGAYNQPDFYYLEDVPWTMYYDDQIALHGAYWHDGFGYRKSHGCVNLTITDAHWLYQWSEAEYNYSEADYTGPAVFVYSSGEYDD